MIRAKGCSFASTSGAAPPGRSTRGPGPDSATVAHRHAAQGSRDLRPVSRAPCRLSRRLDSRAVAVRHARRLPLTRGAIIRTTDPRRGGALQLRSVQAGRCSPPASPAPIATSRTAQSFAPRERRLSAMSRARQGRQREASPPCGRRAWANLHLVPHAGAPTWLSIRATITHSASRAPIFGQAGHAERVQRLPHRQDRAMVRRQGRGLVRSRPQELPDLWNGIPCRTGEQADASDCLPRLRPMGVPRRSRAPARWRMRPHLSSATIGLARRGLGDPDPMARIGALDMSESGGASSGPSPLRSCPTRCAACGSGRLRCSRPCRLRASLLPTANDTACRQ